jgi:hypothetical protein
MLEVTHNANIPFSNIPLQGHVACWMKCWIWKHFFQLTVSATTELLLSTTMPCSLVCCIIRLLLQAWRRKLEISLARYCQCILDRRSQVQEFICTVCWTWIASKTWRYPEQDFLYIIFYNMQALWGSQQDTRTERKQDGITIVQSDLLSQQRLQCPGSPSRLLKFDRVVHYVNADVHDVHMDWRGRKKQSSSAAALG